MSSLPQVVITVITTLHPTENSSFCILNDTKILLHLQKKLSHKVMSESPIMHAQDLCWVLRNGNAL